MATHKTSISSLLPMRIVCSFALALAGCGGFQIRTDYDRTADFSGLSSYAWLSIASDPGRPDELENAIRDEIERQLTARGLHEVLGGEPDLLVRYRITVEEKVEINDPYYAFHEVETYGLGTLLVELVEPATRHVIWLGSASARLRDDAGLGERQQRAREAVREILAKYPPPASGS